ncbi:cytochrome P450 [Mobilicoccus massiliensis]|uniref:cytochrome P450 n=1 Tax=Mobilicoccus massiliensis TaxID=1522310 RepID=UPI0009E2CEA6|nr:cytochrome P450 [Mobilicoccus massiliensis]
MTPSSWGDQALHPSRGDPQLLVHGRDGQGSGLLEGEIRDQAVTLIAAGYETTSAAMGWILYLLGTHVEWQRRAIAEVDGVLGDRAPEAGDLARLHVVHAIVDEALRLYPPAVISARHAVVPFEFEGVSVSPGDAVIYSPYVTHRDSRVFDEPAAFRPERWLNAPRRRPEEYVPFGGGGHRCLGSGMATTKLTVMLARLMQAGGFELVRKPRRAVSVAAMRPAPGVGIRLREPVARRGR